MIYCSTWSGLKVKGFCRKNVNIWKIFFVETALFFAFCTGIQQMLCKINRLFLAFFCEYWYNKDREKP